MSFDRPPESYARFMGVFATPLADQFMSLLALEPGQRALDVGCGTGILTARLVDVLGAGSVCALDPSPPFVAATGARFPEADVRQGSAEALPWDDDSFDVAAAQLVVHFMSDPVGGLAEMLRVTRPGGRVAACVWDHAGRGTPLAAFWRGVHAVDPTVQDETDLPGSKEGHLPELLDRAGGREVTSGSFAVSVRYEDFATWWEPYTFGIGPAGDYVATLDDHTRAAVEASCRALLGDGPFTIDATAWWTAGVA